MGAEHFRCPAWAALPSKNVFIQVMKDGKVKEKFMLNKDPYYLIGRDPNICDFQLQHKTVSRVHVGIIHHKSGGCFFIDLKSAFGSRVNNNKVEPYQPTKLEDGAIIQIGQSSRQYVVRVQPF
eukprot:NODE_6655_length_549_cov_15.624000_g6235_i0.p2 GENE.NODE_6655_length_549_cov_15.624000_g6235_i0~~NODE_6655_length_549_cov_15.624000_g6235_i0.p2  ORF type:complete len:123 (+),score=22.00 NODE_6655_length_549_cov_15.624000_g6235_i0:37-405(+)